MDEINYIYFIFFFLIILQSIVGVGILVIGTPSLLLLEYSIIEILSILLPISILTSLLNLLIFNFIKTENKLNIDTEYKKLFYYFCIPSIFIGLIFLKSFNNYINFDYLVSAIILISIFLTNNKKYIYGVKKKSKIFILIITGIIHGLTNSGGSLMSLFFSSYQKKDQSRYNITYFYFYLVIFQYCAFIIMFNKKIYNFELIFFIPILLTGVTIGNYLSKYINIEKFKLLITSLSIIVCFALLLWIQIV